MTVSTPLTVQQLYIAYFGRPADPGSLVGFPASGQSIEQIVPQLTRTEEYQINTINPNSTPIPGGVGRTFNDTNLINAFYVRLFGRIASSDEVAGWNSALATGAVNRDYLGLTILNAGLNLPTTGAAGQMRAVLQAKIDSAQVYSGLLYNQPVNSAAYSTLNAIQDGISFLNGVRTSTSATLAATQGSIDAMVAQSGAGGSTAFSQTAANAVLTNAINTNNTAGPGFTPTNAFLSNNNDTIVLNGLNNAFVQDSSTTDSDTVRLAAGATSANSIVNIENIVYDGAGFYTIGNAVGVKTITFGNFGNQGIANFDQVQTAATTLLSRSGVIAISAANVLSALSFNALNANEGTLTLNGNNAATSVAFSLGSATTQFSFNAGAQNALANRFLSINAGTSLTQSKAFTLIGTQATFTAGASVVGAGDFTLNFQSGAGESFHGVVMNTQVNVSLAGSGRNTINLNTFGNRISANLTVVSGLDALYVANTGGGVIGITANFNVRNNAFTISFNSANLSNGFTGLQVGGGIRLSAQGVSGASDTLTLNFNNYSNQVFSAGAVWATGFETLNWNSYQTAGTLILSGGFAGSSVTTFNLNASVAGDVTLLASAANGGMSGLVNIGLSQAGGGITFLATSAIQTGGVQLAAVFGSGSDFIDIRTFQSTAQNDAALSAVRANISTIDISAGGADTIRVGFTAVNQNDVAVTAGTYQRFSIAGFGVSDVLSFTGQANNAATAAGVVTVAALTAVTASLGSGNIVLFYDGTDTLVFFSGTAFSAGDSTAASLAAVLTNTSAAAAARWNLNNQGALQLIA